MKAQKYSTHSDKELQKLGSAFLRTYAQKYSVFALIGALGAGKTTCVKGMAQASGVTETITSPTFTLIQEYALSKGKRMFVHVDLYRIKKKNELIPIGLYDHLTDDTSLVCIEWADRFPEILKKIQHIEIQIRATNETAREITVTPR